MFLKYPYFYFSLKVSISTINLTTPITLVEKIRPFYIRHCRAFLCRFFLLFVCFCSLYLVHPLLVNGSPVWDSKSKHKLALN